MKTYKRGKLTKQFHENRAILLSQTKLCRVCGNKESKHCHHINYNDTDHRLENLILVCVKCHKKLHNKFRVNLTCKCCGKEFEVRSRYYESQKFCSRKCYWTFIKGKKGNRTRTGEIKKCPICSREFYQPKCHEKVKTCSKQCGYRLRKLR